MPVDQTKLDKFMGKAISDVGAAFNAALVVMGDKLGLYKAMAGAGPQTSAQLAQRTGTSERYVREWLGAQAAIGYVEYDSATGCYTLPDEQALAFANDDSPAFMPGLYQLVMAALRDEPKIREVFRTGAGFGWHEHDPELFQGTERFFRPNYATFLISSWIPKLDGVEDKLKAGGRVADVGCGHGASTLLMAEAFPKSTFVGFDYHPRSIEWARKAAAEKGLSNRVTFEVSTAKEYPGADYDFVTFFDCLHDMGDPAGAAAHVLQSLDRAGTWMIVEPLAGDRVEQNLNPVSLIYYCASTLLCVPGSLAQEVGLGLGAQAGEARIRDVVTKGGFTRFRKVIDAPINLVFEARP